MQTTLELPDDVVRSATAAAVREGRTLDDLVAAALRDRLKNGRGRREPPPMPPGAEPPWMRFYGAFGKTPEDREETRRIQAVIDAEFGLNDLPRDP